jgi:excisionase family DNA binding protein
VSDDKSRPPGREVTMPDVQPTTDSPALLTVEAAAHFLSLGRTTVYALMEAGKLRYKRVGRARRIPRAELEHFATSDLTGGWNMAPHTGCCGVSQDVAALDVASAPGQRPAIANGKSTTVTN